jgi:hypothetical protein
LIDALAHEGEHVDDGRFTLDPAKAREKLRDYQLADPHGYLLLLVEAAWLAAVDPHAGKIEINPGTLTTVEFSGVTLEREQLTELFSAVLGGTSSLDAEPLRRARVLQLLGLAANNALALAPENITIEASDASGGRHRVEIGPKGALKIEPAKARRDACIRFCFHGRSFGVGRRDAERKLLDARCRATRLGVFVDGRRVSRGPKAIITAEPEQIMLDGREIGTAGYDLDDLDRPGLDWYVNRGVSHPLDAKGEPGAHAVVEVDLAMDLSRNQLSQGPELDAVRDAIRAARGRLDRPKPIEAAEHQHDIAKPTLYLLGACALLMTIGAGKWLALRSNRETPQTETRATREERCRMGSVSACDELLGDPRTSVEQRRALLDARNRSK